MKWPAQHLLVTLTILLVGISVGFAQPSGPYPYSFENFYQTKARLDKYYDDLRKNGVTPNFSGDAGGYGDYKLWIDRWSPLVYPDGDLGRAVQAIRNYTDSLQQSNRRVKRPTSYTWQELGPRGAGPVFWRGRVVFLSFDPQESNTMLTGSTVGGLFYTDDGGSTWNNGGMDLQLPETSAAHCVVDPKDSNVWFCATGERQWIIGANWWSESIGIYRTSDRGATWELIATPTQLNRPTDTTWDIHKLLSDPSDPNVLYAATSAGLYKTTNALAAANAVTWSLLRIEKAAVQDVFDIEYQPGTSTLFASGKIVDPEGPDVIVTSTDAGDSWGAITVPHQSTTISRISMAVTPANPDLIYAVVLKQDFVELYRFSVSTLTWTDKGVLCTIPDPKDPSYRCLTQSPWPSPPWGLRPGHAASLAVSPTNADLVYIGDIFPATCSNGTDANPCTWTSVGWFDSGLHADISQIAFSPDGNTVWAATDGGVFRSTPNSSTWTDAGAGIAVSTILGMSNAASDPDTAILGLYDNGTEITHDRGKTWFEGILDGGGIGGDGLQPMADYTDPTHLYATWNNGDRFFSSDGMKFSYRGNACPNVSDWHSFSILNPVTPTSFFAGACPDVQRTVDMGKTYSAISSFGSWDIWRLYTADPNPGYLAPSNPDYLYAHALDNSTPGHKLYLSTNANAVTPSWNYIALPRDDWFAGIALDPSNPNVFTLAYDGFNIYDPTRPRVYHYDGPTWTDWTGNLNTLSPISMDSIVAEAGTNGNLYVGGFAGVFVTNNNMFVGGSPVWKRLGDGLPHTEVSFLEINYVANNLRAGTFGRGLWESPLLCPDDMDLVFSGTQTAGWYEAVHTISSTAQVSQQVTYRAGTSITLGDGFSVSSTDGKFRALIHGCGQ